MSDSLDKIAPVSQLQVESFGIKNSNKPKRIMFTTMDILPAISANSALTEDRIPKPRAHVQMTLTQRSSAISSIWQTHKLPRGVMKTPSNRSSLIEKVEAKIQVEREANFLKTTDLTSTKFNRQKGVLGRQINEVISKHGKELEFRSTYLKRPTSRSRSPINGALMSSGNKEEAEQARAQKENLAGLNEAVRKTQEKFRQEYKAKRLLLHSYKDAAPQKKQQNQPHDEPTNIKSAVQEMSPVKGFRRGGQLLLKDREAKVKNVAREAYKAILGWSRRAKKMGLTLRDLVEFKLIPSKCFELPDAKQFLVEVGIGNIEGAKTLLKEEPRLLYQYDTLKRTALHRAIARGNNSMVRFLLTFFPDLEARDIFGKSPLDLALKANDIAIVRDLLIRGAEPLGGFRGNTDSHLIIRKANAFWHTINHLNFRLLPLRETEVLWRKLGNFI